MSKFSNKFLNKIFEKVLGEIPNKTTGKNDLSVNFLSFEFFRIPLSNIKKNSEGICKKKY